MRFRPLEVLRIICGVLVLAIGVYAFLGQLVWLLLALGIMGALALILWPFDLLYRAIFKKDKHDS